MQGRCSRGDNCRYAHGLDGGRDRHKVCRDCGERGHIAKYCREFHRLNGTLETVRLV